MKKLFTFLAGAALLGSLSACSSDEPAKGPDGGKDQVAATMYMAVKICSADNVTRADYDAGSSNEHAISQAKFFYFGATGNYICEASVENMTPDNEYTGDVNVELQSANVLVLRGVTETPKFMVTILNGGTDFLTKVRNEKPDLATFSKYYSDIKNGKYFVMSTTSFYYDGTDGDGKYDDTYYYANVLNKDWLTSEKIDINDIEDDKIAIVYVERLAAKFTIDGLSNEYIEIPVTVAGNENSNNHGDSGESTADEEGTEPSAPESAHSGVFVKVLGWDVSNVEEDSYILKQFGNVTKNQSFGNWAYASWNKSSDFRSFWGQSVHYGQDHNLKFVTAEDIEQGNYNTAVYTHETTNTKSKISRTDASNLLQFARVGSVVVLAQACEKDKNDNFVPLQLIEYGGLPYRKEHFLAVAMNRLPKKYYQIETTNTGEGESLVTNRKVTQVGIDHIKLELRKDNYAGTGSVILTTDLGDATQLYEEVSKKVDDTTIEVTLPDDGGTKYYQPLNNGVASLKADLKEIVATTKAVAYTDGMMFYTIPVEHLNKKTGTNANNYVVEDEANYGIVRNHWYNISVSKIMKLGHGIFIPEKVEGKDPQDPEPLIPDDPNDTYRMAARINILSWKLVKQSVVL